MSHSPLNAKHSHPQKFSSNSSVSERPEFAALVERLQGITQEFFTLCKADSLEQAAKECVDDVEDFFVQDEGIEEDESADDTGETRCYYFSPTTLKHERALLKTYDAEDFRGLLFEAHITFMGLVELMKNIEPEVSINSYVVYSLGCLLEHVSSLIFKMQDVYSTVEQVKA